MLSMHKWRCQFGQWYLFTIYPADEVYDFAGVVYLMTRHRPDGYFDPLYLGQTGDAEERLTRHEKLPAARRLGLSHIHVHFEQDKTRRLSIETALRRNLKPPLNEQSSAHGLGLGALGALPVAPAVRGLGLGALGALPAATHSNGGLGLGALGALADIPSAPDYFLPGALGLFGRHRK